MRGVGSRPSGRRVGRRAVVRIDADAGERELATCWCGRSSAAPAAAQAGDGGRVGAAGRRRRRTIEPARGRLAGDVEQVLDRDRQAGERARVAPAAIARSAAAAAARAASKSVAMKACAQARRSAAAIELLDPARRRRPAPHAVARASVRSAAHRECYNRVLCLGRTSGRIHRSGEAVAASKPRLANRLIQGVAKRDVDLEQAVRIAIRAGF